MHLHGFDIGPFTLPGNNNTYFSYSLLEVLLLPLVLLVEVSGSKSQSMLYLLYTAERPSAGVIRSSLWMYVCYI